MKKSLFIIAMSLVATIGFAQENKWNAGLVIGYGTDISKASLGGRVVWDIIEPFSVAAGFNRYFKDSYDDGFVNTDVKYWDLNLDFHWNVLRGESYNVYPLIGLTYLHGKASEEYAAGFTASDIAPAAAAALNTMRLSRPESEE